MKKLLTTCLLAVTLFAVGDMLAPQDAQALMPLACTTAMDYGWRNYGWNVLCVWHLQMEQGYYEGPEWDGWSSVTPNEQRLDQKMIINEKTYALTTTDRRDIRYPLRA